MRLDFGVGVKQLREEKGASVAELAAVAGVSLAHQYRIEAGERTADVLYLYRIIRRYGVDSAATVLGIDSSQLAGVEKPLPSVVQKNTGHGAVQVAGVRGNVSFGRRR